MEPQEILTQARIDGDLPAGWTVFPLQRQSVMLGLAGWLFGVVVGLGLFALIASIVIPVNYQHGVLAAFVTTLLLAVLLFVGLGSAWTFVMDVRRLRQADKHIIVITPQDFVKQEGDKIIHVPLSHIRHVTARGQSPAEKQAEEIKESTGPRPVENTLGFLLGRGLFPMAGQSRRKKMRTPESLAFIDARVDKEVVVVNDKSYGDPHAIADVLKEYAIGAHQLLC
jgi:hypothetical protein